jgi:hypothetical protein
MRALMARSHRWIGRLRCVYADRKLSHRPPLAYVPRNGTGQARRLLGAICPCDHGNAPPCRRIFQKWWLDKARTCPAPEGPGARQAGPLLNPNRSQSQVGAYSYDPLGKSGPQLTDFACWVVGGARK